MHIRSPVRSATARDLVAWCPDMSHRDHDHDHGGFDDHGNPEDLEKYLAKMDDPERDEWQKPDVVVAALGLTEGDTIAEIGSGTGYFTFRLAEAVGPGGRVFAVEVDPRIARILADRLRDRGLRNVTPVMAFSDDPLLPPGSCQRILLVNSFHHVHEPVEYLRKLAAALRPGGRVFNIDFAPGEQPVGPPDDHKLSPQAFIQLATEAGLKHAGTHDLLEHQYVVELAQK